MQHRKRLASIILYASSSDCPVLSVSLRQARRNDWLLPPSLDSNTKVLPGAPGDPGLGLRGHCRQTPLLDFRS